MAFTYTTSKRDNTSIGGLYGTYAATGVTGGDIKLPFKKVYDFHANDSGSTTAVQVSIAATATGSTVTITCANGAVGLWAARGI